MSTAPQIPGFEFEGELGRGGMAVVYLATEVQLARRVAIKVVSPDAGAQQLQRLEVEARGLAALQHPNIVPLHAFGRTDQGAMYYVMPLLTGGDLTRWPAPAPPGRVIPLLESLLDALAHAHDAGIIHRDIKPENILFDAHGRPMLADFGAALVRERTRLTDHGTVIGSTGYMSPEQARGADIDARSDLYSLAVVAFELISGRPPFEGKDDLAIALAQVEQPVPRLANELSGWHEFFARALAADPARRFQHALEMRDALGSLHAHASVSRRRITARVRRVGSAALVFLVFAAIGWWVARDTPTGDEIAALIAAGALTKPADPNATDALRTARRKGLAPARADSLQADLLDRLATATQAALSGDDASAWASAWHRWSEAVKSLDAGRTPAAVAIEQTFAGRLETALNDALARLDRNSAAPALAIVDQWPGAPQPLRDLATRVRELPEPGDRFRDRDGPELVLARLDDPAQPTLAVMARPLDTPTYERYFQERVYPIPSCPPPTDGVQRCVDFPTALDLAAWLSDRTGQRYRVPSREELAAVASHVEPAAAHAWTSTCNLVRTKKRRNVVERTWSGVKEILGGGSTPRRYVSTCAGYIALPLDRRGTERVLDEWSEEATLVLVRETTPPDT